MPSALRSGGAVVGGASRQGPLSEQRTRESRVAGSSAPLLSKLITPPTPLVNVTGTASSAFGFSTAATGIEIFTGTGDSTFTWSDTGSGKETFLGVAASAFAFSDAVLGSLTFTGTGASTFTWSEDGNGVALLAITAIGASRFGFGSAATGEVPTTGGGMWRPFRLRLEPGLNAGAAESMFGFRARANGVYVPLAISALGSSEFAALVSAIGVVDARPILDELWILGIGDEDLIGI